MSLTINSKTLVFTISGQDMTSKGVNKVTIGVYSECQKKIYECIRVILRIIVCDCWKFDEFIPIAFTAKDLTFDLNGYLLPKDVNELCKQLKITQVLVAGSYDRIEMQFTPPVDIQL